MSQKNIDLLRQAAAAVNTRELSDEVAEALFCAGCRLENIKTAVTDRTYYGATGLREWISDTFEGLDGSARFEVGEMLTDAEDFAVTRVRLVGHGAHSGAPVELRWVNAWWFQDGKITRVVGFARRHEALKAVELEE